MHCHGKTGFVLSTLEETCKDTCPTVVPTTNPMQKG